MKQLKLILLALMIFNLTHCRVVKDQESTQFTYPETTKLVLTQDIPVPPTEVEVVFQFGKIAHKVKRYQPFCELTVRHKNDRETQQIPQGEYAVVRVVRESSVAAMENIQLASNSNFQLASAAGDEFFSTVFFLAKDTPLRSLNCRQMDSVNLGEHLKLSEIRDALGEFIKIQF